MCSFRSQAIFTGLALLAVVILAAALTAVSLNRADALRPLPTLFPTVRVATPSPILPTHTAPTAAPPAVSLPPSPTSRLPTLPPQWTDTFTPPPTRTRTPTPIPTPTSTPAPASKILPPHVNPLTGETVSDPTVLDHPPFAVKIANTRPCARPQSGLNQAAAVFEHYVEAWITRFTAIFYGTDGQKIGPIRSARLIDLELPAIFGAMLVMSGESGGVKQRVRASDFAERVISADLGADCPPLCRVPRETVTCNDTAHTLYTNTADLHAHAAQAGLDVRPTLSGWTFNPISPKGGQPAEIIHIDYLNAPALWTYDPPNANYVRMQDRLPQTDALTGERLSAANVVVLYAHHLFSDIQESPHFYSLEIQFWGQGRALVFRDGQVLEGLWLRPQRPGLFRLVDASGTPIPLKPGRTWFEFVPLDAAATTQDSEWTITAPILPQQTPPHR
jgi:hypothetical protein